MYRIPQDLDISKVVGQSTTQLLVGQYDIQLTLGEIHFAIESPIKLIRNGAVVGTWQSGAWPAEQFFDIMNVDVVSQEIPNDRTIIIRFENGIEMHLCDNSDQFECMQIYVEGESGPWII